MNEIVDQILRTEKHVEEIIQKARQDAQEIKQKSEKKTSSEVEEARKKANHVISSAIESAKNESLKLREQTLKKAEEEGNAIFMKNRDAIQKLVKDILRLIIHTEFSEKDS
jgi:vacuolar-type H+-ATPase subunit H